MNKSELTQKMIILIILTIICFIFGREVFDRFDGELFSHSAVPLEYSLVFILLLISIGITLRYIIEGISVYSAIILWWPLVHITLIILCSIIGMVLNIFSVLVLYSIIILPINLMGEGISLGFQINHIFIQRDQNELSTTLLALLINLIIIIYVISEISKDYLANLFM